MKLFRQLIKNYWNLEEGKSLIIPFHTPVWTTSLLPQQAKQEKPIKGKLTWVDFPVVAHTVGIHDVLEAWSDLVGPDESRWSVIAGDAVHKGWHRGSTPPLCLKVDIS